MEDSDKTKDADEVGFHFGSRYNESRFVLSKKEWVELTTFEKATLQALSSIRGELCALNWYLENCM